MTKEEIFNKIAQRLMHTWNIESFKVTHKRLYTVIMEAMREYHDEQVTLGLPSVNLDEQSESTVCTIDDYCPNRKENKECKVPKGMCAYQQTGN